MIAKLQPNRVRRTYLGGGRINAFTGFTPDNDGALRPEDWLASTTTAYNGTLEMAGEGLGRVESGALVRDLAGELPILVKLLDSDERLVIQAHPTVPFARERLNSPVGKTECWYFLPGTAPDACVYLGFKKGITRAAWKRAFADQDGLLEWLHRVPVKEGDLVFVDGGIPHAIGAGCFMIELQEPSDLMVVAERTTPSNRIIPDGKIFGGLDLEGMLDVYCYRGMTEAELSSKYVRRGLDCRNAIVQLVGKELTDKFEMWRLSGGAKFELGGSCAVMVATSGAGTINGQAVKCGERLIAFGETSVVVEGTIEMVICK